MDLKLVKYNDCFSLIEKSKTETLNAEDDQDNKRKPKTIRYSREIAEAFQQAIECIEPHRPPENTEVAEIFLELQSKKGSAAAYSSDEKKVKVP